MAVVLNSATRWGISVLRQLGVDLKVQQELLRHADVRTTMNIYTHALNDDKREANSMVVQMVLPR